LGQSEEFELLPCAVRAAQDAGVAATFATAPDTWRDSPRCDGGFHPLFCFGGLEPLPGHLSRCDIQAIPDVDEGYIEEQGGERLLVIMASGFVPDLVRDRLGPVSQAGDCLSERESGAFGVGEVGSVPPGGDSEEAFVGFPRLFEHASMHVQADATAVDLAGAQMNEVEGALRHVAMFHNLSERHQRLHCFGENHYWIFHSWLHDFGFSFSRDRLIFACHYRDGCRGQNVTGREATFPVT